MPDRSRPDGASWYSSGAQKGILQPPYVVRWKGRWYRTVASSYMTDDMRAQVDALPRLEYAIPALHDYLNRTRKHFRDLPLWPVGTVVDEDGKPPGFDAWLAARRAAEAATG